MNNIKLALIVAALLCFSSGINVHEMNAQEQKSKVYICTGKSATTYHKVKNCTGLSSCKSSIKEVTIKEAQAMNRRPCKICYK